MPLELPGSHQRGTGLVDVLDRVLDKGLVIAGDIKVSLAEVELLTIRIRLLVCSLDKAQEIGLDWWRYDRDLSPGAALPPLVSLVPATGAAVGGGAACWFSPTFPRVPPSSLMLV